MDSDACSFQCEGKEAKDLPHWFAFAEQDPNTSADAGHCFALCFQDLSRRRSWNIFSKPFCRGRMRWLKILASHGVTL